MKIRTPVSLNTIETRSQFTALPKGNYPVRVINYTPGVSAAGNEKINLDLEVSRGEYSGRKLWDNLTPGSTAALPFVKIALEAFSCPWDDEGFDPVHLLGKEATAVVDIDTSNPEKVRNIVRFYKKL